MGMKHEHTGNFYVRSVPLRGTALHIAAGVIAFGAAFTGGTHAVHAQPAEACVVHRVDGDATISARGAGSHVATPGLGIGRNATLSTGADTRVTLTCPDGLEVVLGPDSTLTVSGLLDGAERPFGLRLMDGIAGFLFGKTGGDGVQVRTPSAVAAVRSTEWAMRVQDRATAVFARDGVVFVGASDQTVMLKPGDGIDVTNTGEPGSIKQWGQGRIDMFATLLGPDW